MSIFIRTCLLVELIKLQTPILNPVILIKPVGKIYLDNRKVFIQLQLKTFVKHHTTEEGRWPARKLRKMTGKGRFQLTKNRMGNPRDRVILSFLEALK